MALTLEEMNKLLIDVQLGVPLKADATPEEREWYEKMQEQVKWANDQGYSTEPIFDP